MLTEKQFEEQLMQRRFEPPGIGFAERIIAGAKDREPNLFYKAMDYIRESVVVMLPKKPVYTVALLLVIGILIGTSLPPLAAQQQVATTTDEEVL